MTSKKEELPSKIEDIISYLQNTDKPEWLINMRIAEALGWVNQKFSCININGAGEMGSYWRDPDMTDEDWSQVVTWYKDRVSMNMWPDDDNYPLYTSSWDYVISMIPDQWVWSISKDNFSFRKGEGMVENIIWHENPLIATLIAVLSDTQ